MVKTRSVAYRLAAPTYGANHDNRQDEKATGTNSGFAFLEVTQKGKPILNPTEETVRGPIRLRLLRLPPSHSQKDNDNEKVAKEE
mmetsp:Transcript_24991/g.54804  ORF Transcript_24991/g.54804 Transcript_24991/m.54804 type:complete len:85 (+) Transcript_24991:450-704(+)